MKKKQRSIIWLLMFLVSTGALLSQSQIPHLFVKFSGTASPSSAGDFGGFVDKNDPAATARSFFQGFGGEIGLETKKHAVGISAGYIERYLDIDSRYSFSAVPIFLFIRYKLVNGSFLKASLTVGEGVYLARYQEKAGETVLLNSKKNSLGFHGGVSVDLHIFKFLAVSVDAGYRLVSFKEMVGKDYRNPEAPFEGSLYYQANEATGEYGFFIKQAKTGVPGSRPAVFNLNGFILSAGMKIIL